MNESMVVKGFQGAGLHCGIKETGGEDLSLIFSVVPARATGVFTTNAFKAAPVELSSKKIRCGWAQAIITNSGNANAGTGEKGLEDAERMSWLVARALNVHEDLVLVASTGVIGKRLPLPNIAKGIAAIVPLLSATGIPDAQRAIMTTDKFPKTAWRQATIDGKEVRLVTIAKGAGMIQPHMATLLAFTLTDANVSGPTLRKVFRSAVNKTLNSITVDGCMSTNDTALILANGCAGNTTIDSTKTPAAAMILQQMVEESLEEVATMIVSDGEGATKIMEIAITGAPNVAFARKVAYAIGNSALVKTAFYGGDPNLGRIIGAIGASSPRVSPSKVSVRLENYPVFTAGTTVKTDAEKLERIMAQKRIKISVSLGMGNGTSSILAADLSHEYVDINAHYHT